LKAIDPALNIQSFIYLVALTILVPLPAKASDQLYRLIGQRLALMEQVAAYKWINRRPIEDTAREKVVIAQVVYRGLDQGITVKTSADFFQAQIDAAKDIQQCWFDRWRKRASPDSAVDLNIEIRPRLISLGSAITSHLSVNYHDRKKFNHAVRTPCLSRSARDNIFDAIEKIAFYPDRLTQIAESGILRIGTTGDYAPFSHADSGSEFTGIDIDLARDLAASLGVSPVFVQTSWPTLMADLESGKYDIGMSGISRTVSRAKSAYFSDSYHIGGKTPISLCRKADTFDALEKIDQPGVRIIVNPGGTNEKFVDTNIRRASKVLHDDNRTVFDEIIAGNADLMITDDIEVSLQAAKNESLCPTMPGRTLTYQEKGYLLPQNEKLREVVNLWLSQVTGKGKLANIFAAHLNR
jgi:cyclohexadienyl dehydratase